MRGLVIFLLVLAGLSLFSFMAVNSGTNKDEIKQDSRSIQFKTFTSAVCEEKNDLRYCRDVLFVNCNGKISKASEVQDCNGFKPDDRVTGFAVFENN
jgi:hypothetical protein